MADTTLTAKLCQTEAELKEALDVRFAVFRDEQGYPGETEVDERDPISAHLTLHDATSSTPLRALGVIRLTPYPIPPCPTSSTWPLDSTQLPAAELAKSFAAAGGAKISRVAVRPELRGKGGGAKLMLEAEKYIREAVGGVEGESAKGVKVVLSSQLIAVKFYDRLGYKPEGDVYDEEGQPHIWHAKTL